MDQAMLFPRVKGAGGGRVLAPTSGAFGSALRDIFPYGEVGSEQALGVTQPSFCAFREGAIAYIGATDTLLIQALCQYGGTVPSPDNSAGFIRQAKATNVLAANGDPKLLNFTYSTAYATSSRGAGGWGANSNFLVDLKNGTVLRGHVESAYTSNTSAGWSDYPPG